MGFAPTTLRFADACLTARPVRYSRDQGSLRIKNYECAEFCDTPQSVAFYPSCVSIVSIVGGCTGAAPAPPESQSGTLLLS